MRSDEQDEATSRRSEELLLLRFSSSLSSAITDSSIESRYTPISTSSSSASSSPSWIRSSCGLWLAERAVSTLAFSASSVTACIIDSGRAAATSSSLVSIWT